MRQDYKLLAPSHSGDAEEKAYAEKASHDQQFRKQELRSHKPLQRLEASCSITQPLQDAQPLQVTNDRICIKGYAVGQDGSPATQVWLALIPDPSQQVTSEKLLASLPADLEWKQARIHHNENDPKHSELSSSKWSWAWTLWQLELSVPSIDTKWALIARCVTASGIEQQKTSQWNMRGFCNRSWSLVRSISVQSVA